MRHFTPASILSSKTLAKFTVNESQVADVLGKLVSLGFVNQRQTEYSFTIGPLRDWLISTSQDQGAFGGERVESVLLAGGSLDDLDLGYSDVVALESEVANSNQGDPTLKILDCEHLFESIVAIARLLTSELTTETLPELLRKILAFANCQTKGNWAFRDPRGEIALVLPSQTSRSDSVEAEHSVGVLPKS
ncbi:MAG TPA: hypothetical protein DDW52_06185 [Planctomycetaceae bacterium]|nr:hypothetical protein [Planctomycetaceae bacterium]